MKFAKSALSVSDQLAKLADRGLIIGDKQAAERFLRRVSYYRLSGYTRAFYVDDNTPHRFSSKVTFDDVQRLYEFDRELRLLVLSAIDRIEIAFRTAATNYLCQTYGSLWFTDSKLFQPDFHHDAFLNELEASLAIEASSGKRREQFLDHYFRKYTDPALPPGWMIAEILSIGAWSRIYEKLRDIQDRKKIAHEVGRPHLIVQSWMHSLT